jgi:hypothetical protein
MYTDRKFSLDFMDNLDATGIAESKHTGILSLTRTSASQKLHVRVSKVGAC